MNPLPRFLVSALALTLVLAPARGGAQTVIDLPADPPSARTVTPREMWRIGGEDDEDVLLGLVVAAVQGPDRNTYLLDGQLSQVLVISPAGELLGTVGREGDGPGELRRPQGLFFLDDETLAVVQGFPGRVSLLKLDGTPAGVINFGESGDGGFRFVSKVVPGGNLLVASQGKGTFDQSKGTSTAVQSLGVFDREGNEKTTLATHTRNRDINHMVFDEQKDFSELNTWTASGDGLIYTAPERERYVVAVYDLTGARVRTLRRPFTPHRRSNKDKEKIGPRRGIVRRGRRIEVERHILDTDPAILGLNVAADGRLFVSNGRDRNTLLPEGIGARYDVISSEGDFIEELSLAIPDFDPDQDRVTFLDGKRFLLLRNIRSASEAFRAGIAGGDQGGDEEDLGEAEPLEAVLYEIP